MLLLISKKATKQQIQDMAEDFGGYTKIVVDIQKKILAGGGGMHTDGEKLLLEKGSKQENLWGGGLDLETREIDFDSLINIRPHQSNPSREVLSSTIRGKMIKIIENLLL